MTLETAEGFNNPPIVYDAFGRANDSGSVVVDVLEGAYDPDGSAEDLEVVGVGGDDSATVVDEVSDPRRPGRGAQGPALRGPDADGADGGRVGLHPPDRQRPALRRRPTRTSSSTPAPPPPASLTDYVAAPGRRRRTPGVRSPLVLGLARRRSAPGPTATAASRSRRPDQLPRTGCGAGRGHHRPRCERQRGLVDHRGRRDRPALDPGPGRRRQARAPVPLDGRADLRRADLRPRHRHLLQGLHARPPRRGRPRLRRRVEPALDGLDLGSARRLGRAGHGRRHRDAGRRGGAHRPCGRQQHPGGALPARAGAATDDEPPSRSRPWRRGRAAPTTSAPTSQAGVADPDPTIVSVESPATPA